MSLLRNSILKRIRSKDIRCLFSEQHDLSKLVLRIFPCWS